MLTTVTAGPYTIRGVSVGGVYTSLAVPELDLLLDAGIPMRSAAGAGTLLLSHGHADHAGALGAMLGIRALHGQKAPLKLAMPAEIVVRSSATDSSYVRGDRSLAVARSGRSFAQQAPS
jgi:ribonuclease Z